MQIELTPADLEQICVSLSYSKQRIADAEGTPYAVRQENLKRIDDLLLRIRAARK